MKQKIEMQSQRRLTMLWSNADCRRVDLKIIVHTWIRKLQCILYWTICRQTNSRSLTSRTSQLTNRVF